MKSTIPAPAAALLDFLAKYESGGNYLAYYGHAKSLAPLPSTLNAVLSWQAAYVQQGHPSSAIGRYQFMPPTLRGLMAKYGIPGGEAFTSDMQDELGFYLLVGRGYDDWITGKLSDSAFADNLSKEWASMPYHTGYSYYDGDHLNKSLVPREEFIAAIAAAKRAAPAAQPKEKQMVHPAVAQAAGQNVDFIKGLENMAGNFIGQIESTIKVGVSPNNGITVAPAAGSTAGASIFSSISNAQLAITELGTIVADAKAGKWQNEPADILAFLKTIFVTLSAFGIVVPGLTQIVEMMPDLPKVEAAQ